MARHGWPSQRITYIVVPLQCFPLSWYCTRGDRTLTWYGGPKITRTPTHGLQSVAVAAASRSCATTLWLDSVSLSQRQLPGEGRGAFADRGCDITKGPYCLCLYSMLFRFELPQPLLTTLVFLPCFFFCMFTN